MRILLIEDDAVLGAAVRDQIAGDGHSVDWVQRLDAADTAIAGVPYDLVLLDLMLPDGSGLEVFVNTGGRPLGMAFDAAAKPKTCIIGAGCSGFTMAKRLKDRIQQDLNALRPLETDQLLEQRYQRLMGYGYC